MTSARSITTLTLLALTALPAHAQDAPPPEQPAERAPDRLPSLDDLLGLEGDDAERDAGRATAEENQRELERRLEGQQIDESFQVAITLMNDAALRLTDQLDAGLTTQRIQEEILLRLEELIDQAEQQQQQMQASAQPQQSQQQQQPTPQQQQAQQNQQREQSGEPGEATPPGFQEGELNDPLDAARAAWGALPARVRDSLMEGSSDRFSSLYERLTRDYYRKLAEERRDE